MSVALPVPSAVAVPSTDVLRTPGALTLGAVAGLAHVAKPLWKWAAVQGLGLQFGSISAGVAYAVGSHLAFGTKRKGSKPPARSVSYSMK